MLPLTWISLAFLGGIILASQIALTTTLWLQLAAGSFFIAIAIFIFRRIRSRPAPEAPTPDSPIPNSQFPIPQSSKSPFPTFSSLLPILLIFIFLGAARYQAKQPDPDDPFYIAWYSDRDYEVLVTGTLIEPPDYRDTYTNLHIEVSKIGTGNSRPLPVNGTILARVDAGESYRYGDPLRVRGYLKTPPSNEDFSYRDYLALSGIHAYMSNAEATRLPWERGGKPFMAAIFDLKERALANVYELFPDPEASLLAGILLGVGTGMPRDLQQAFKDTGTTHIIAISGFNITIIAGLFISLFGNLFGKTRGAVAAVIGIAIYTILVGADAAVVRAALMGGIGLLGRQIGRRQGGINSLLFVAVVMAIINPLVLWDVGFQLSFAATLGLILYANPLAEWFVRQASRVTSEENAKRLAGPVGEYILFTLAAQLTTIPIMAYHFGRISLISFLANPFILPVQPAVMIVGGVALIFSLIYFPLGKILAMLAWPFTTYTIRAVEFFDRLPQGVIVLGDFSLLFMLFCYAALLTWTFAGSRLKKFSTPITSTVIISSLTVIAILAWRAAFAAPDGRLHITFFDVGSADAVLIQTPGGRNILVNGGESISKLSDALGRRLPPFQRQLDWLIVASTQEEQLAALPRTLERFPPDNVLWSGNLEASYASRYLDEYLSDNGIPVTLAETGQSLDLGQDIILRIQAAGPRGAALLIEWDSFRALFPIGMSFDNLKTSRNIGNLSVLLLADSGYAPINPPEWIDALRPQLIVLSVAADDENGLPHRSTLKAVRDYALLRTDLNGWIHITTDGQEMWVESQR